MRDYFYAPLLGLILCGCAGSQQSPSVHEHVHKAPHGGQLVEVGEEFAHLELIWDADKGALTVYVLDGECEACVRLRQTEIQLRGKGWKGSVKARANPLSEEKVGDTSQFGGTIPVLRGRSQWGGEVLKVTVNGRTFEHIPMAYAAEPSQR